MTKNNLALFDLDDTLFDGDTEGEWVKYMDQNNLINDSNFLNLLKEFNNNYREELEKHGLILSGFSKDGLVEMIEIQDHPWFIACQFHPEFTSSPLNGHPLFQSFIEAAVEYSKKS